MALLLSKVRKLRRVLGSVKWRLKCTLHVPITTEKPFPDPLDSLDIHFVQPAFSFTFVIHSVCQLR